MARDPRNGKGHIGEMSLSCRGASEPLRHRRQLIGLQGATPPRA